MQTKVSNRVSRVGRLPVILLAAATTCASAPFARPALAEVAAPGIVDEGPQDASLVAVRQRLIRIFETRDRKALTSYLHPQIVVGTGVIGPRYVEALNAEDSRGYAARLRAGGRFARPGLFFVFYDEKAQREADFRLDETKPNVHSLHGLTAVRSRPSDQARKLNEFAVFRARLLPSPTGTPSDWAFVEHDSQDFDWRRGYVRKRDIASQDTDGVLILLKVDGRWWIVRMCLC